MNESRNPVLPINDFIAERKMHRDDWPRNVGVDFDKGCQSKTTSYCYAHLPVLFVHYARNGL